MSPKLDTLRLPQQRPLRGLMPGKGSHTPYRTYADGVLRTNEEWAIIRASFASVHARRDAYDRRRKPKPRRVDAPPALLDEDQLHLDAILAEGS